MTSLVNSAGIGLGDGFVVRRTLRAKLGASPATLILLWLGTGVGNAVNLGVSETAGRSNTRDEYDKTKNRWTMGAPLQGRSHPNTHSAPGKWLSIDPQTEGPSYEPVDA
ncbi:hypothetical protein EDB83DRAFT_2318773 [Lactarius deliciosus]|nr:hypothetical protein EDB83DRAFT_2318773 [Lactarius deliciosus]